jgi:hypothetical protein
VKEFFEISAFAETARSMTPRTAIAVSLMLSNLLETW